MDLRHGRARRPLDIVGYLTAALLVARASDLGDDRYSSERILARGYSAVQLHETCDTQNETTYLGRNFPKPARDTACVKRKRLASRFKWLVESCCNNAHTAMQSPYHVGSNELH